MILTQLATELRLFVDITFTDHQDQQALRQLLCHLFPGVPHDPIRIKVLEDGLSNKLILVHWGETDEDFPLLVKIYGHGMDSLVDRQFELLCMTLLQHTCPSRKVYAVFNNGLCYSFHPGSALKTPSLSLECFRRLIAIEMAHFHCLPVVDFIKESGIVAFQSPTYADLGRKPILFPLLRNWIHLLPSELPDPHMNDRYKREFPSPTFLLSELGYLESLLSDAHSPLVLCHNDLLAANIICSPDRSSLTFIDMEYCGFNHAAYDIGNHFCEFMGIPDVDYSHFPTLELQREWITCYLEAYAEFADKNMPDKNSVQVGDVKTDQLDIWLREVNQFSLVSHLLWSVWAIIRADSDDCAFDYLGYALARIASYRYFKPIMQATFASDKVPERFVIPGNPSTLI